MNMAVDQPRHDDAALQVQLFVRRKLEPLADFRETPAFNMDINGIRGLGRGSVDDSGIADEHGSHGDSGPLLLTG